MPPEAPYPGGRSLLNEYNALPESTRTTIEKCGQGVLAGLALAGLSWAGRHVVHKVVTSPLWAYRQVRKRVRQPVERFKLTPTYAVYTEDKDLVQAVAKPLVHNTSGVLVFATKPGSGKTTTVREVVRRLQKKKLIAGAVYVDCEDVTQLMAEEKLEDNPYLALRLKLLHDFRIPRDTKLDHNFSAFFESPWPSSESKSTRYVMVLDQFELFTQVCKEDKLQNMVKGMALDAAQSNVHQILINVADEELAKRMYEWNSYQKIVPLIEGDYEPSRAFIRELAQSYRDNDDRLSTMSDEEFEEVFTDCTTPGMVVRRRDQYILDHVDNIDL
eukprot:m.70544 g.70544  ORF g.70544 m.70544 type:complete len:329 (-) comp8651_c0_seq1:114-1100(-)